MHGLEGELQELLQNYPDPRLGSYGRAVFEYRKQGENLFTKVGIVVDNRDPMLLGRVRVEVVPNKLVTGWIPVAHTFVGDGYGIWNLPDIGTEVVLQLPFGGITENLLDFTRYFTKSNDTENEDIFCDDETVKKYRNENREALEKYACYFPVEWDGSLYDRCEDKDCESCADAYNNECAYLPNKMVRHGYGISDFPAIAEMMKKADIRNDAGFLKKDNKVWHFHPVYFYKHLNRIQYRPSAPVFQTYFARGKMPEEEYDMLENEFGDFLVEIRRFGCSFRVYQAAAEFETGYFLTAREILEAARDLYKGKKIGNEDTKVWTGDPDAIVNDAFKRLGSNKTAEVKGEDFRNRVQDAPYYKLHMKDNRGMHHILLDAGKNELFDPHENKPRFAEYGLRAILIN